ncbi:uncharacterized protein PHACADRAFT_260491 [Phanerochaete carnosa HHB-10118-sp]|uniref:Uncharacterized protein n=1 Tax=Phanerochaete carnosa (strain HHB-10118-sp) TaxID=650164 RepID=K5W042_PHACS|nr:uncharacterized protein PHACADRAFT_260491 [Phanerochaete carnosa HHB-10118-sp]EKM52249.1 hypothetical protein PHACADRAFT_260491 [Phanerochaete carnosa HHB-10118-sp]
MDFSVSSPAQRMVRYGGAADPAYDTSELVHCSLAMSDIQPMSEVYVRLSGWMCY